LRNQTANVISRHEPAESSSRQPTVQNQPSISPGLTYNVEACAVSYLFSRAVMDWRVSHGHLDFLQPLYMQATSESPLALSANWLGVVMMDIYTKHERTETEGQLLSKVIKSINTVINDPVERLKDETLHAVLLLAFGEYLRFRRFGMRPTLAVHQTGAEALIRSRGDSNFRTPASVALFTAARHNAVSMTMQGIREFMNWDIWTSPATLYCANFPKAPGTQLDDCGILFIDLQNHLKQLQHLNETNLKEVEDKVEVLLERLNMWENAVPSDWLPHTNSSNLLNYPSPEVCYISNQWYLLRLDLSHLILEIHHRAESPCNISIANLPTFQMNWITKIIASELSFVIRDPVRANFTLTMSVFDNLPQISAEQCYNSPFASQLLGQTLRRLKSSIARALQNLNLTPIVQLRYEQVLTWVMKEEETIREAFPLSIYATPE
jgi:hypothetical protein